MSHDVFICHASEDRTIANAICSNLEQNRIRCWVAPRDVVPGSDYAQSIVEAIATTRLTVLVFSHSSNRSPHVKREIERSVSHGIPILPFRVEDVAPSPSLEYFISDAHWLDAVTPPMEQHLKHLAGTVRMLLDRESASSTAVNVTGDVEVAPDSAALSSESPLVGSREGAPAAPASPLGVASASLTPQPSARRPASRARAALWVWALAAGVLLAVLVLGVCGLTQVTCPWEDATTSADGPEELIEVPVLLYPPAGTVFHGAPEPIALKWRDVYLDDFGSYTVEVDCFGCCVEGEWCTDVNQPYLIEYYVYDTTFTLEWPGTRPGRWRVWAVDNSGIDHPKSGWWEFGFGETAQGP